MRAHKEDARAVGAKLVALSRRSTRCFVPGACSRRRWSKQSARGGNSGDLSTLASGNASTHARAAEPGADREVRCASWLCGASLWKALTGTDHASQECALLLLFTMQAASAAGDPRAACSSSASAWRAIRCSRGSIRPGRASRMLGIQSGTTEGFRRYSDALKRSTSRGTTRRSTSGSPIQRSSFPATP